MRGTGEVEGDKEHGLVLGGGTDVGDVHRGPELGGTPSHGALRLDGALRLHGAGHGQGAGVATEEGERMHRERRGGGDRGGVDAGRPHEHGDGDHGGHCYGRVSRTEGREC